MPPLPTGVLVGGRGQWGAFAGTPILIQAHLSAGNALNQELLAL